MIRPDDTFPRRPGVAAALPPAGLAVGVLLGALTNVVNGSVSPWYFAAVMGWEEREAPTRAIFQGMLEGAALGLIFGVVTAMSFAASTGFRGTAGLALRSLLTGTVVALACWAVGGACAVLFVWAAPDLYRATFYPVPPGVGPALRFAWVGGSIWGAYAGCVLGGVAVCVSQHVRWRRLRARDVTAFEVLPAAAPPVGPRPRDLA